MNHVGYQDCIITMIMDTSVYSIPSIATLAASDLRAALVDGSALLLPVFEQDRAGTTEKKLDTLFAGRISKRKEQQAWTGKAGSVLLVPVQMEDAHIYIALLGCGAKKTATTETLRLTAGTLASQLKAHSITTAAACIEDVLTDAISATDAAEAIVEGIALAQYSFTPHKSKEAVKKAEQHLLNTMTFFATTAAQSRQLQKGIDAAQLYIGGITLVRDMVNQPGASALPKDIAAVAKKIGEQSGISATIYTKAQIKKMKMGGLLGVSAGSAHDPYFIHLKYTPKKKQKKAFKKVAICGKGITFDSGGLSLKPSDYMTHMKLDMAGAATILGLFSIIDELQPNVEVHGVIPTCENMISAMATRPGDVLTAYNGKTIEVTNTDAEGRLILADALSWAEDTLEPDAIIDLATLTGAALYALGQETAAVMASDDALYGKLESAAAQTGERFWRLPLIEEYRQLLKSPVADIDNCPATKWAGTIIAALFLQNFVEKTPWVHIDIAGAAYTEKQVLSYVPFGGTGFGVRTLAQLLKSYR